MSVRSITAASAAGAVVAAFALPPFAGGAPTSAAPPAIDGPVRVGSPAKCTPGSWSADAVSFSFEWTRSPDGGATAVATGDTYTPKDTDASYRIYCRVTAVDAGGGATQAISPGVVVEPGQAKVKLTYKKVQKGGKVTIKGVVSPAAAYAESDASAVGYRVIGPKRYTQLGNSVPIDSRGRFKIVGTGQPSGKRSFMVNFHSGSPSTWASISKTIKITIKKR